MTNRILTHEQIQHIIKRIAYQIYEVNVNEKEIIVAGIAGGGVLFAKKVAKMLEKITDADITFCKIEMDKQNPLKSGVSASIPEEDYRNRSIVLIDDVLNSGTTLIYGVHHFLKTPIKQLRTAVLVNRNHKKYPIKADYKGISLSTSLNEHIKVEFKTKDDAVYLE
ncbi:phosphoribosyltransferase family protein [Flagellimonas meishanensis]|uniref:phosphoribosyltransferase family protein n=1 Tax=Flagellimonas meishanensis TaxID=2873264 RepID=UPI001CA71527|nr:phosphoribosyltransferase family protein [[Muricauda] meishanensis]